MLYSGVLIVGASHACRIVFTNKVLTSGLRTYVAELVKEEVSVSRLGYIARTLRKPWYVASSRHPDMSRVLGK
jgi:hypothetical protein